MNKYNDEEIFIFKRVISDYNLIKKEIDERIEKGYKLNDLYDYIRHLNSCGITNFEFSGDFKYVDFNYGDMCLSIIQDDDLLYLGDTIEIWNDNEKYYIGTFNNVNELKKIIKYSTKIKNKIFNEMNIMGWNLGENEFIDYDNVLQYHIEKMEYMLEKYEDSTRIDLNNWVAYISNEEIKNIFEFMLDFVYGVERLDRKSEKSDDNV